MTTTASLSTEVTSEMHVHHGREEGLCPLDCPGYPARLSCCHALFRSCWRP